jgi:NTP pyrophosphatase (non-canonical NTP hydrolase)
VSAISSPESGSRNSWRCRLDYARRKAVPWDREQTHESLRKFLIEETYEVLDAMEKGDSREFSSELGDLLLQIVFHSILAEERGRFTISDVIESVHTKMVRRHPHVFGKVKAKDSSEVLKNWEQIKAEERAQSTGQGREVAGPEGSGRFYTGRDSAVSSRRTGGLPAYATRFAHRLRLGQGL